MDTNAAFYNMFVMMIVHLLCATQDVNISVFVLNKSFQGFVYILLAFQVKHLVCACEVIHMRINWNNF